MADRDAEKRAAAEAAAALVEDGTRVGLGTGSTVAPCCPRWRRAGCALRCVATSVATEVAARALGLAVEPFEQLDRLDIAIDGADQIAPDDWVVKGGGGAHTREKVVARAADRFVVIASGDKVGRRARAAGAARAARPSGCRRRCARSARPSCAHVPLSPDGGAIADYRGAVERPGRRSRRGCRRRPA